jgi:hypothetical protein
MKQFSLFLLMAGLSINSFSQIQKPISKGNVNLSGYGSFYYSKTALTDETSTTVFFNNNLTFSPGVSYFVIDNFSVGLNAIIGYGNHRSTIGFGPIIKYYFNNGLFLKMIYDYSYIHETDYTHKSSDFSSGIGYAFFINQKVSLEPCISYLFSKDKQVSESYGNNDLKENTFQFSIGFNIFL